MNKKNSSSGNNDNSHEEDEEEDADDEEVELENGNPLQIKVRDAGEIPMTEKYESPKKGGGCC